MASVDANAGLDSTETALHDADILSNILTRVAEAGFSYHHALTCRRWLSLSPSCQTRVRVRDAARLDEADLLKELQRFPNLTSLHLGLDSVEPLTDFFLGAVSCSFPKLRAFSLSVDMEPGASMLTSEGLSSFVSSTTRLTSLVCCLEYDGESWELPHRIDRLAGLEVLEFGMCLDIPDTLGSLTSLRHLDLKGSTESMASLPAAITNLVQVTSLSLKDVEDVPLNIGALSSLIRLSLHSCSPPQLPPSFTELALLEQFTITSDMSSLPDDISRLSSLKSLKLLGCEQIRGLPPGLCLLSHLEHLAMWDCVQLRDLPGDWGLLGNLETLEIGNCGSIRELPASMGSLPSLESLSIFSAPGLSQLPQDLSGLQSLNVLDLVDLEVLTALPESLSKLDNLEILRVLKCPRLHGVPRGLLALPKLKKRCKAELSQLVKEIR